MSLLKFFLRDVLKWTPELPYHYPASYPSQLMAKLFFKRIMQKFGVTEISNFYLQPNNLHLTGFYFSSKYGYAKVKTRERQRNLRYWYLHGAVSSIHIGCPKSWMSEINTDFSIYFFFIYLMLSNPVLTETENHFLYNIQFIIPWASYVSLRPSMIYSWFSLVFYTASLKKKKTIPANFIPSAMIMIMYIFLL